MRKNILLFIFLLIAGSCFSQQFEVIREYKFGTLISYTETWDPIEGGHPGIYNIKLWNNNFLILNESLYAWHLADDITQKVKFDDVHFPTTNFYTNEILVLGEPSYKKELYIYTESKKLTEPNYILDLSKNIISGQGGYYYTENKLFINGVYWELLPGGKTVFHDAEQTKKEMENGLAEHLGISDDDGIYFGETCITTNYPPNYKYYWNNIKILTDKYKNIGTIGTFLGTDKKGISYFYKFINSANEDRPTRNPDLPITVLISALDSWTHEAEVISLPAGDWNPARNENGLIAVCSQCMDEAGKIYFTDCNKEKGCYEIKKLSNDWVKKYDFYKREVGRMNANHIPLQLEAKSSAKNNGYNFDHEYLWILEKGNDWCKVRKVDGREGWVETRYINFDDGNKVNSLYKTSANTNVSENRIMTCNDNLRLRKEEATGSAIITTMQKGTKVKILKLGKPETIDGINSNWVQVEVLAGAKDKDGNALKAGTIGWCYGGYLE